MRQRSHKCFLLVLYFCEKMIRLVDELKEGGQDMKLRTGEPWMPPPAYSRSLREICALFAINREAANGRAP